MRLVTINGKTKVTINQKDWETIGRTSGWLKGPLVKSAAAPPANSGEPGEILPWEAKDFAISREAGFYGRDLARLASEIVAQCLQHVHITASCGHSIHTCRCRQSKITLVLNRPCVECKFGRKDTLEKTASRKINLVKLRRLFDGACQGLLDESLLNDIYSEWHRFLATYEEERPKWLKDCESQEDVEYFTKIYDRIKSAWEAMDRHYTSDPSKKILILNFAIQAWHDQEPLLAHYSQLYGREHANNEKELSFLDWLQNRQTFQEKSPPPTKTQPPKHGKQ